MGSSTSSAFTGFVCLLNHPDGGEVHDDYIIKADGSIVLMQQTEDKFHRFYNENGEFLFQTNQMPDWGANYRELYDAIWTVETAMYRDNRLYNDMFDRAKEVGWDPKILEQMQEGGSRHVTSMGFDALKEFIPWAPQDKTPPISVIDKAYYYFTNGRILKYDVIKAWNVTVESCGNIKNQAFEGVKFLNQPNNRFYFAY